MVRRFAGVLLLPLAITCTTCGGRPFAEGGSRELSVVTSLPSDSPEILLLRAVLERPAIRIEDETAYSVRLVAADDARVFRARTVLFFGYGSKDEIPEPLEPLSRLRAGAREPFVFAPDVWLRGQAAGMFWTERRENLLPLLTEYQNRLFLELDRATFATVRSRLLALPRDSHAERRLGKLLGFSLRVPRGYEVRIDPRTRAVLLLEQGPPTRLLRIVPDGRGTPAADLKRARASLARIFRPNERTLDRIDPTLTSGELAGAGRQIHGRWEDSEVSAAGPYRFYEVTREGKRFYVDLAVFAPGRPKLPYLRELQAIAETLSAR
ncbi:MAG TPA: hypothetical protein VGJ98_09095 [Candidatus Eisenbacteria bacterium]|jgi:hypothetical protein